MSCCLFCKRVCISFSLVLSIRYLLLFSRNAIFECSKKTKKIFWLILFCFCPLPVLHSSSLFSRRRYRFTVGLAQYFIKSENLPVVNLLTFFSPILELNLSHYHSQTTCTVTKKCPSANCYFNPSIFSSAVFSGQRWPSQSTTTVTSQSITRRCSLPQSLAPPSTWLASRSTTWMVSSQQPQQRVSGKVFELYVVFWSVLWFFCVLLVFLDKILYMLGSYYHFYRRDCSSLKHVLLIELDGFSSDINNYFHHQLTCGLFPH